MEDNIFRRIWDNYLGFKRRLDPFMVTVIEIVEFILLLLLLSIVINQFLYQRKFIPSKSMMPNLQVNDQIIISRVHQHLRNLHIIKPIQRGDVLVFYPPMEELPGDPVSTISRLSGFSRDVQIFGMRPFFFMPRSPRAFIKRVIGLPGDHIEVRAEDGVYINGRRLTEAYPPSLNPDEDRPTDKPYPFDTPDYDLVYMQDFYSLMQPELITQPKQAIIVPEGHYFCLGDNRRNSTDSHVWGFVSKKRVIGTADVLIWRGLDQYRPALYPDTPYEELIYQLNRKLDREMTVAY